MTDSEWTRDLLQAEYDLSSDPVDGFGDVREPLGQGEPEIVVYGNSERRTLSPKRLPIIRVEDNGTPVRQAKSVGYRDEEIESEVTIEVLVTGSRDALRGQVQNEYGGYAGEVKRVLDEYRTGIGQDGPVPFVPYDIIEYGRFDEDAERYGADIWMAMWDVSFVTYAKPIKE